MKPVDYTQLPGDDGEILTIIKWELTAGEEVQLIQDGHIITAVAHTCDLPRFLVVMGEQELATAEGVQITTSLTSDHT